MTATLSLNTRTAQETKLHYLAAAAGGDALALLAYADWLEENGSEKAAKRVRADAEKYAAMPGTTMHGETWSVWNARWQLTWMAESVVGCTAFRQFRYDGNYNPDGSYERDDRSMAYALARGYVPTLRMDKKQQRKLGRIIEALGYRVFWTR